MKRVLMLGTLFAVLFGAGAAHAYINIYKWVKDKRVNSDQVLKSAQASRVIPLPESAALNMIRGVMTEDLFLAQAEYHKTKHIQDAETTPDTVLPEEIVGQKEVELIDEDYRFFLEVKLRAYGGRTRITAKASPMYRIHDIDAEAEANSGTAAGPNITVNAGAGAAVAVAAAFVQPFDGLPLDYHCDVLPDAAARAAKIVRSFMYLLDKRVAAGKPAPAPESRPAPVMEQAPASEIAPGAEPDASAPAAAGQPAAAVEVNPEGGVDVNATTK
jgi:hypothetical protein